MPGAIAGARAHGALHTERTGEREGVPREVGGGAEGGAGACCGRLRGCIVPPPPGNAVMAVVLGG